jgi:hypothetical protein
VRRIRISNKRRKNSLMEESFSLRMMKLPIASMICGLTSMSNLGRRVL